MTLTPVSESYRYAGLFRRLFAIFYDCFLLGALLFIVSALFTALNAIGGGEAVTPGTLYNLLLSASLAGVSFLYFGWFWTHGGQTLGMKTWRIQLVNDDAGKAANNISWQQAFIRFSVAIFSWLVFSLGFVWCLLTPKKQGWHDLLSHSVLIDLR